MILRCHMWIPRWCILLLKIDKSYCRMNFSGGKENIFVGCDIKLKDNSIIEICMKEYIREYIVAFDEQLDM